MDYNNVFYLVTMSTYTTSDIRNMVDDLDDKIRAAVVRGDIATVFTTERDTLVRTPFIFGGDDLLKDSRIR